MTLIPHEVSRAKRVTFLGCPVDLFDMRETLDCIVDAMQARRRLQHVVINVAKLVNMQSNEALARDVADSDLINIDGAGVMIGARLMGIDVPERVTGIDLMEQLLAVCAEKGFRPYFFGAKPDVLEKFISVVQEKHPDLKIAGWRHGYFSHDDEAVIANEIKSSNADCLFIAISSPIKENFLHAYRDTMDVPFLMGVGGSIDVMAGLVSRAPRWMQLYGLEWLYRLIQEPKRMWRRYLYSNSQYSLLLGKAIFKRALRKLTLRGSQSSSKIS